MICRLSNDSLYPLVQKDELILVYAALQIGWTGMCLCADTCRNAHLALLVAAMTSLSSLTSTQVCMVAYHALEAAIPTAGALPRRVPLGKRHRLCSVFQRRTRIRQHAGRVGRGGPSEEDGVAAPRSMG